VRAETCSRGTMLSSSSWHSPIPFWHTRRPPSSPSRTRAHSAACSEYVLLMPDVYCLLSAACYLLSAVCCPPAPCLLSAPLASPSTASNLISYFNLTPHARPIAVERCTAGTAARRQHSYRLPTRNGVPHHRTLHGKNKVIFVLIFVQYLFFIQLVS
jgi:hypothetical protein